MVTPGITCIWQVKGRAKVTFLEWVRMDIVYIRSRSILKDVFLILLTIPAILSRKGAY
jgi:lipopolysaccharide/colanic/teichoic acid biosynthesis glycosyltransferase